MRRVLHEPLVHFLLLGAVLFALFEWRGGAAGSGSSRIVVTPGLVEHLSAGFTRTWQRAPDEAELKGLVDEYIKEEIAAREAMAMGLDRDDAVIRRRLRQKLEFLAEDAVDQSPPTDAELRAWLDAHPAAFRPEPHLAYRQVYFSPGRPGRSAEKEARALAARLRAAGPEAPVDALGDASLLPSERPLEPLSEVSREFGEAFASKLADLAPAQWAGPIESPYGWHVVLVRERLLEPAPELDAIRPQVERELLAERRRAALEAFYQKLLEKYRVAIEMPKADGAPAEAGSRENAP